MVAAAQIAERGWVWYHTDLGGTDLWVWLMLLPLAYYLPLLLHELSHLVVMKKVGAEIASFKPYWHFAKVRVLVDGEVKEKRQFWFGRVTCRWPDPPAPAAYRYSHVAPLVKACVVGTSWALLAWLLWTPLALFAACEAVDGLWWWVGYFRPGKDAYKWFGRG